MASASELPSTERLDRARELCARANAHVADGARRAKRLTLEGLYLLEADAGTPATALAEVLLDLGLLRELLGERDAAETTYRRAIAVLEAAREAEDVAPLRSRAGARLAQLYCLQRRFEEADALSGRWRDGFADPAASATHGGL